MSGNNGAERSRVRRTLEVRDRDGNLPRNVEGKNDSWYRPGQLLVERAAEAPLRDFLSGQLGGKPFVPVGADEQPDDQDSRLRLWTVRRDIRGGLDQLVADRRSSRGTDANGVYLNQVFFSPPAFSAIILAASGRFHISGLIPEWTTPSSIQVPTEPAQGVGLAVLDTGLPSSWPTRFEDLAGAVVLDPDDLVDADEQAALEFQGGHGLFICGLVHRVAPGLGIEYERVLTSAGDTDDYLLSQALRACQAPVINLSLGGYSDNDEVPPAFRDAIADLDARGTVVVAAAGNYSDELGYPNGRKFWPASLPEVIGVGAYDSRDATEPKRPNWTNTGSWVKVCAPGQSLRSRFLYGFTDPVSGREFAGWARWSGTSFAAPLVAAEIARRVAGRPDSTARQVADELLAKLDDSPWPRELGKIYHPPVDLTDYSA